MRVVNARLDDVDDVVVAMVHLYRIGMGQTDRESRYSVYLDDRFSTVETSVTKLGKKSILKVCLQKFCQNIT